MDDVYDFGLRLKNLRRRKKLTQKQLGDLLQVTKDTISHYENNTQTPSVAKIVQLAIYLNTSTDYLLGRTNKKEINI